jgi:hypothetical protein
VAGNEHDWQPFLIHEVVQLLESFPRKWILAGGRALDAFLGRQTRPHDDIDVLIAREDRLDFDNVVPYLNSSQKTWLKRALITTGRPDHEWLSRL